MTSNKEKNFKREKRSHSMNQPNQTRRQRVLKQELYEKEAQMLDTCEELVKTYEKLQMEIRDYPDVVLKKIKRLDYVLTELSEQVEEQIVKTTRLADNLNKVSQSGLLNSRVEPTCKKRKTLKKIDLKWLCFTLSY